MALINAQWGYASKEEEYRICAFANFCRHTACVWVSQSFGENNHPFTTEFVVYCCASCFLEGKWDT